MGSPCCALDSVGWILLQMTTRLVCMTTAEGRDVTIAPDFAGFLNNIRTAFDLPPSTALSVNDLSDLPIDDNAFCEMQRRRVFPSQLLFAASAHTEDLCKLPTVAHEEAIILPHVNILIHGGDEYDYITALAELVDNSVQKTKHNLGSRRIAIDMQRKGCKDCSLSVWDNGCGMSYEGIKRWATMGLSGDGFEDAVTQHHATLEGDGACTGSAATTRKHGFHFESHRDIAHYLTSEFSRYGVGSKKAIFNLGDSVTMTTKSTTSRWVYEVKLSRQSILEDGWKTSIHVRAPRDSEVESPSFTHVHISDIKTTYIHKYNSDSIRREIAHLYHYYIWGPNGNVKGRKRSSQSAGPFRPRKAMTVERSRSAPALGDPLDSGCAEDEDFLEENPVQQEGPLDILVDGKNLRLYVDDDMETRLLTHGVEKITFDLKVTGSVASAPEVESATQAGPIPGEDWPLSQSQTQPTPFLEHVAPTPPPRPATATITTHVKAVLFYYPYRDGRETLPIPRSIEKSVVVDDETVPLSDRNPGFECFWMGRLLPGEKIAGLPFMKKDSSSLCSDIPVHCYRRVKGMLFLDSHFEVSANKLYLCRQTALAQALLHFEERALANNFRKWLRHCHAKYDEEIIFEVCTGGPPGHGSGVNKLELCAISLHGLLPSHGAHHQFTKQCAKQGYDHRKRGVQRRTSSAE